MSGQTISSKATLSLFDMFPNATKEQLEALSRGLPVPPTPGTTATPTTPVTAIVKTASSYGVSCIMPIADMRRRNIARACVNRFLLQQYPDKELIIVNATGTTLLDTQHPLLTEVMINNPALSIGAMRNMGIQQATKPWIAQWDDDDYRDPHLLAYQMGFAQPGKAIMLNTIVLLQLKTGKDVTSFSPSAVMNTMAGQPSTIIFPNTGAMYPEGEMEDENFYRLHWANKTVLIENEAYPYNMYVVAVHHGLNQTPASVFMKGQNDSGLLNIRGDMAVRRLRDILLSFGYRQTNSSSDIQLTPSPALIS